MNSNETYHSKQIDELLNAVSSSEAKTIERRMLLAAKIHDAMIARGLSKLAFAKRLKKSPSVITKWLSGTHNFTIDTLFDIEEVLQIDIVNVMGKPKLQSMHFHYVVNNISAGQKPLSAFELFQKSGYSLLCTASGVAFSPKSNMNAGKNE